MGDAAGFFLDFVGKFTVEAGSGAEEFCHLVHVFGAGDDGDFFDAGVEEDIERIENEGPVVDGEEAFVGDFGEGAEARAGAAADEDAFHDGMIADFLV